MRKIKVLLISLIFLPFLVLAESRHYNFDINGMMCKMSCVPIVTKAISRIDNVKRVEVNFDIKQVDVFATSEVSRAQIITALSQYGEYSVGEFRELKKD